MKKRVVSLVFLVGFLAVSLMAQMTTSPKPLDTPMIKWMVGEWEGWLNRTMGKSQESLRCAMDLNDQFLLMVGSSKAGEMDYHGMGAITVDLKTGNSVGYWIDNFRGMYEGTGKEEGNKIIMEWGSDKDKSTRIIEKVGPDKMKISVEMAGAESKIMTISGEMTRKKKTE